MLQLLINGEPVDLSPDASITIDEESPVFDKDTIPGGFSFPFNLPITPRNRRILGFPERIEKQGPMSTEQPFHLFHQGILRFSGTITVTEASDTYKANMMVGSGNLASRIKGKKLKDLDLGGTRTWEWKPEYKYPDDDFALFPIHNEIFMQDHYDDAAYILDGYWLNVYSAGEFYHEPDAVFAICPFPYLIYIIRRIMSQYGFQIQANVLESNKDFRDLVLYNNYDITCPVPTTEIVEIFLGTNQYGDELYEEMEVATVGRGITTFDLVNCVPDMLISDFILSIRNLLNIAFVFDSQDHVSIILRQDTVLKKLDQDITDQVIGIPLITAPTILSGFKLAWNHDDNDTIFKDGFKAIDEYLALIKDPVLDFVALAAITPVVNEIRAVQIMDAGYYQYAQVGETNVFQWQKFGIGFQNYLDGLMGEVFETKFSTLIMETWQRGGAGPSIRLPRAEQLGNSVTRAIYQEFSPRLLFYRGMQLDSNSDPYPMGSNDCWDRTGEKLEDKNLVLKWQGDFGFFGLYKELWKKYLTWWMARKQVTWTIKDPSLLRFDQKYAIDGKHYLLKKRTINLTQGGIEPGECEFYLV